MTMRAVASILTSLPKQACVQLLEAQPSCMRVQPLTHMPCSGAQAALDVSTSGRPPTWQEGLRTCKPRVLGRPKALFLDAAGTFLIPTERVTDVYLRYGRAHGVRLSQDEVLARFRSAYNEPWGASTRYAGDARDFWASIVHKSLGCSDKELFEDIYQYYEHAHAWKVPTGMVEAMARIRRAGITTCVVSNFDTRLRPLMAEMGIAHLFDHIIVSAEVGAEKPSPVIFEAACQACGVDPSEDLVIHVGDDRRNDVWGARDSGLRAWLWGIDVVSFKEIADRVVSGDTVL